MNLIQKPVTTGCAVLLAALAVAPVVVLADDWYWVNDAGGRWDDQFGDLSNWRTASDVAGMPDDGDAALLVLPYSFSFCQPGGACITQPVVVHYRSEEFADLLRLDLESYYLLLQTDSLGTPASHLRLSSVTEVVGGSTQEFTPPPSFVLPPDGPGIFPVGRHMQEAGLNTVREMLVVGLTQGVDREGIPSIEGIYELSGTGQLHVGEHGFGLEKIGAAGDGRFVQSGGEHVVEGSLILGEQSGGTGEYELSGGSLDVGAVVIVGSSGTARVEHSDGTFETSQLILGQHTPGSGLYTLTGDGELVVRSTTTVAAEGKGSFVQQGGVHRVANLMLNGSSEEFDNVAYQLHDGELTVTGTTTIGATDFTSIKQTGGTHHARRVVLGDSEDATGYYELVEGHLTIDESLTIGQGTFEQIAGQVRLDPSGVDYATLSLGTGARSRYYLEDGLLDVAGRVYVGVHDTGDITQSGGEFVVRRPTEGQQGYLFVGETDWGWYTLEGGTLEADHVIVGHLGGFGFLEQNRQAGDSRAAIATLEIASRPASIGHPDYPGQNSVYLLRGGTVTTQDVRIGTGAAGIFHQTGGSATVTSRIAVGAGARGQYEQTGGIHVVTGELVLATTADSFGHYELTDATLEVTGLETIGATGRAEFHHSDTRSGYQHRVEGELILGAASGSRGDYFLAGDPTRLTVIGTEMIGQLGAGTITQNGGTHTIQGQLVLGDQEGGVGEYLLQSGELIVEEPDGTGGSVQIARRGNGSFQQSDGTHTVGTLELGAEYGGDGQYVLNDGQLRADYVRMGRGAMSHGRFEQTGGNHTVFLLSVGGRGADGPQSAVGEYILSNGNLESTRVQIGDGALGEFEQSGGVHTVADQLDIVGDVPTGTGHYTLSGGSLEVRGDERVGGVWDGARGDLYPPWATFTQAVSGTMHRVEDVLHIGETGEYALEHGALLTNRVVIAGGQASDMHNSGPSGGFVQTGGTHIVDTLTVQAAADYWGRGGNYTLYGGTLIVEGDLNVEAGWSLESMAKLTIRGGSAVRISDDTLHNHGLCTITGEGASIEGHVDNRGQFEIRQGSATFDGLFEQYGELFVEAATVQFRDLRIGPEAKLQVASGDTVIITGNLTGTDLGGVSWETNGATLAFRETGRHTLAVAGEDRGPTSDAVHQNFAWNALQIPAGVELELIDGNPDNNGNALYVGALLLEAVVADPGLLDALPLIGDAVVYYDATLPENAYLAGDEYGFATGKGVVRPLVPEPSASVLLVLAAVFLLGVRPRS